MKTYTFTQTLRFAVLALLIVGLLGMGGMTALAQVDIETDTDTELEVDVDATTTATTSDDDDAIDGDATTTATTSDEMEVEADGDIEGEILEVEDDTLVIQTEEGERTVSITGGRLMVTRNGAVATIDDILPGDEVTVETETITEFSGEVVATEDTGAIVVRNNDGTEQRVTPETNATYQVDGETVTYNDIQEGDEVTIVYNEPQEFTTVTAESADGDGNALLWIILLIILALLIVYALKRGASRPETDE